jgi:hypothetical protein
MSRTCIYIYRDLFVCKKSHILKPGGTVTIYIDTDIVILVAGRSIYWAKCLLTLRESFYFLFRLKATGHPIILHVDASSVYDQFTLCGLQLSVLRWFRKFYTSISSSHMEFWTPSCNLVFCRNFLFWTLIVLTLLSIILPITIISAMGEVKPEVPTILIPLYVYPFPGAWQPLHTV